MPDESAGTYANSDAAIDTTRAKAGIRIDFTGLNLKWYMRESMNTYAAVIKIWLASRPHMHPMIP